jgi:hypothetical protein
MRELWLTKVAILGMATRLHDTPPSVVCNPAQNASDLHRPRAETLDINLRLMITRTTRHSQQFANQVITLQSL